MDEFLKLNFVFPRFYLQNLKVKGKLCEAWSSIIELSTVTGEYFIFRIQILEKITFIFGLLYFS